MSALEKDEFMNLIYVYKDDLADNHKDILDKKPKNVMQDLIICNNIYPNRYTNYYKFTITNSFNSFIRKVFFIIEEN